MKIRVILFLLLAVSSRAQTITGADVTESGDRIRIYLTGLNTNGSYSLGWSTNNYPVGNEKIRVDLTSPTFNKSGDAVVTNTLSRQAYGTAPMRYGAVTNTYELTTAGGIWNEGMIPDQPRDYIIPYDMDGVARTTRSTPGPFATTLSSGTAARNTARLLRAITLRER